MNRLYEKNELRFSFLWIILYVVLFSMADSLSLDLGAAKSITAPLGILMAAFLWRWITKRGLREKYGLQWVALDYRKYLYFLPLLLIASTNLWRGLVFRLAPMETALYIASMICVGFLEEVIFRGFLFCALCKENVRRAILISSLTFGIGHVVNLLNGADVVSTLLQICYASAVGFLFTVLFYRTRTLLPCIAAHSAINVLSAFAGDSTDSLSMIVAALLTTGSLVYAVWILKSQQSSEA